MTLGGLIPFEERDDEQRIRVAMDCRRHLVVRVSTPVSPHRG